MYFDTHAHYDDEAFDEDRYELIEEMHKNGDDNIINIATDMESCKTTMALAQKYDYIYAAVGVHPHEVKDMKKEDINKITEYCKYDKIVAVGEIGLDFHYDCDKELQKVVFRKQLELAEKYNKPVIIHSRDCIQETYDILTEYHVKGIMHCYSGSVEMAVKFNKIGFYIGVGGISTFKNASKIVSVIKKIPLEYILLETDSPYLTPEPFRGHVNEPANISIIFKKICDIKGLDYQEGERVLYRNLVSLFDKNFNL